LAGRPSPPGGSNIPSASSAVPSSFGDRSKGALGKAKTPRAWVVELLCCIVMCHRLKQSRIATKRFGSSQSPLQSFQTHSKTMEAESTQQIRGSSRTIAAAAPDGCDSLDDLEPHRVLSNILHLSGWRPISAQSTYFNSKVRLFDARSSRLIGKPVRNPWSSVTVAL